MLFNTPDHQIIARAIKRAHERSLENETMRDESKCVCEPYIFYGNAPRQRKQSPSRTSRQIIHLPITFALHTPQGHQKVLHLL
jgi:hypothetical protein